MDSEKDTKENIYFSFFGNRKRQVTKEEWEKEWLNWWTKNHDSWRDESKNSD